MKSVSALIACTSLLAMSQATQADSTTCDNKLHQAALQLASLSTPINGAPFEIRGGMLPVNEVGPINTPNLYVLAYKTVMAPFANEGSHLLDAVVVVTADSNCQIVTRSGTTLAPVQNTRVAPSSCKDKLRNEALKMANMFPANEFEGQPFEMLGAMIPINQVSAINSKNLYILNYKRRTASVSGGSSQVLEFGIFAAADENCQILGVGGTNIGTIE